MTFLTPEKRKVLKQLVRQGKISKAGNETMAFHNEEVEQCRLKNLELEDLQNLMLSFQLWHTMLRSSGQIFTHCSTGQLHLHHISMKSQFFLCQHALYTPPIPFVNWSTY